MKTPAIVLLLALSLCSFAQESQPPAPGQPQQQGEQRRGGRFNNLPGGTIQAIDGDTLTLQSWQGQTLSVKVTSTTRYMKNGQPAKLSDFKVGDRVIVSGMSTADNHWTADLIAEPRRMGRGGGDRMMMAPIQDELGKVILAGEVKSIDGTTLVVHGPDGKDYSAQVDENTSFRRGREDITFPEVKVGSFVFGRGKPNSDGVFVFKNLNVGGFRSRRNPGATPPSPAPPKQ